MEKLQTPDTHHMNAAVGWLELGNPDEAMAELENIAPANRNHPDVLDVEWRIWGAKRNWTGALEVARRFLEIAPDNPVGWINQSYSLHELKRTQEAWDALLPAAAKFPEISIIPYNLACYACQLGQLETARQCLGVAIQLKSKDEIKAMALDDLDLKPLWDFVRSL